MSTFKSSGLPPEVLMELVRNSVPDKKDKFQFESNKIHYFIVAEWLRAHNIRAGKIRNAAKTMYGHFTRWAEEHNEVAPKIRQFGMCITKMFPKERIDRGIFYLLNQKVEHEKEKEQEKKD